jgi:hypothetical protein
VSVGGAELPFIDEHAVEIDAPRDRVWPALCRVAGGAFNRPGAHRFARLLGALPRGADGDPSVAGSTLVGFRVVRAEPGGDLALEGRHRFSRYALTFRIDDLAVGRSRVRAETRAVFPGLHGRAYRALVIGTGGHVLVVRRLLAAVRRDAESAG